MSILNKIKNKFRNRVKKISRQDFFNAYVEINNSNKISELAIDYRHQNWPLKEIDGVAMILGTDFPIGNPKKIYGELFTIGYFVRETELMYESNDIKILEHNIETQKILHSQIPNKEKIIKIAEYKELNNNKIGIGKEVEIYSVIGFTKSQEYFNWIVQRYLDKHTKNRLSKLQIDNELFIELTYRNAALGYCFKLAEEIVLKYRQS